MELQIIEIRCTFMKKIKQKGKLVILKQCMFDSFMNKVVLNII